KEHLERSDDSFQIAWLNPQRRGRVHPFEQAMQKCHLASRGNLLQPGPQFDVLGWSRKQSARQRPEVKPGSADDERQMATSVNRTDGGRRVARILRRRVLLGGLRDVNQVMRDAVLLLDPDLVRADVESAVDRSRVAVDDLAAVAGRECQRQRALSRRGRTE